MANCEPKEETHRIVVVRGVGCTKEAATNAIIDKLLGKAETEREQDCSKLECTGLEGGECVITIDADDMKRLESQIQFYPIRRRKCPNRVGWIARLVADPPKYTSECICAEPDTEEEGDD